MQTRAWVLGWVMVAGCATTGQTERRTARHYHCSGEAAPSLAWDGPALDVDGAPANLVREDGGGASHYFTKDGGTEIIIPADARDDAILIRSFDGRKRARMCFVDAGYSEALHLFMTGGLPDVMDRFRLREDEARELVREAIHRARRRLSG